MTDYITDLLHGIKSTKIPARKPLYNSSSLFPIAEEMRKRSADLDGRELYAFDLSALNAAADLRIDTPERVDRLVTAVLASERRVFIEANAKDMLVINRNLRGILSPWGNVDVDDMRWGAFVDVLGDGRARFQIITSISADRLKGEPAAASFLREARGFEGSLPTMVSQALRLNLSPVIGDIDISRHVGMSRHEFDAAFERMDKTSDPIARYAEKLLRHETKTRRRNKIMDDTWRAVRFRDILRSEAAPGRDADEDADNDKALRNGLPVIAMLAVLAADAEDLQAKPRERTKRDRASTKGARFRKSVAPGLRVVTLNVEDRELRRAYNSTGSIEDATGSTGAGGDHTGRVRHPVRGHLFLARNNKMTWRKPHWRGSLEGQTLKRVVAPSHSGE